MKKTWKSILSLFLTVMMVASLAVPSLAAGNNGGWYSASFTKTDSANKLSLKNAEAEEETEQYAANDTVRVSILLSGKSTIQKFSADSANSVGARNYRAALRTQQDNAAKRISGLALGGKKLDVVWNLTLAANIISANVKYGEIDAIKRVPGVADVVIETLYAPQEAQSSDAPQMTTAADMTGTNFAWASGLTGAGGKLAIIDTGVDYDHISFDGDAFDYAISTLDKDVDLLTVEDIDAVLSDLNAKQRSAELTAEDLYVSSKIPFAYNYIDRNLDATNENDTQGEHGSHVAGIAAANRYVPDGEGGFADAAETVFTVGQAPDAQILAMKVFGVGGGAYDSDYFAAVEDSILLGADATNLSLSSSVAGFTFNDVYQDLLDGLVNTDTVNSNSAGNNGSWADNAPVGYLYGEDKNLATGGSPGTYTNTLSVASVDNYGFTGASMKFFGESVFYTESEGYGNAPLTTLTGDYEFVAIDGFGTAEDFAAISDVLAGKVAICSRGTTSFFEKANAAIANGAVATVIYNNQPGTINMNLTGYEYSAPAVSITQEDGAFIKENAEAVTDGTSGEVLYYTGTMTMPTGIEVNAPEADHYVMSDFSSFCITGSLILKPEITAPGGNIYSVNGLHQDANGNPAGGHAAYENMSGTSMAAPQISGITAIIGEYIRDNDLVAKTGLGKRALTHALLMGTADPLVETDSGNWYSVLKQGAGLVNVVSAINTQTVLTMKDDATASAADGKIKAELGVLPRGENTFSFTFDVKNFGDTERAYLLDSDFFTQDYFQYYEYNADGSPVLDEEGNPALSYYMDTWTAPLNADVVWTVNGEAYSDEDALQYDFDGDGLATYADAQAILEFVVGNLEKLENQDNADLDEDGDIDSYDAYLALDAIKQANVTVAAGEKATINVTVTLNDIDDFDFNGAYVEGYVFVTEQDTEDGAIGVTSSIPVVGFYGDWSEPTMFDHGSYIDNEFGTADHVPYMAVDTALGENAYIVKAFLVNYNGLGTYANSGNPYVYDDVYVEARNAINPNDAIAGVRYTQIRNAGAGRITVTDGDGTELFAKDLGASYAAYYYETQAQWQSTSAQQGIGFKPTGLEDGTVLTATVQLAPELFTLGEKVDWDALADGTRYSQQFTVDGTAPDIKSVDVHYDTRKGGFDAIQVTAGDNQYIAAISLMDEEGEDLIVYGSASDPEAEAGEYYNYVFDLGEIYEDLTEVPDHLEIFVGDYAANESNYKINLDPEDLKGDITVQIDEEEVVLVKGNSQKVDVTVGPWGRNENVTWASDDETIASVDANGVITGVAPGTTTVTVTSEEDPEAFDTVNVTVKEIVKDYDAVVWDENGEVWFSRFTTNTIPAYDKKNETSLNLPIASLAYDENGVLYGATFDSDEWLSNLYIIDEDTYEATLVGSSSIGYMDIAPAPGLSDASGLNLMIAVYGTYAVIVDKDTGDYQGVFDLGSFTGGNYLVGAAYQESFLNTYYNLPVDWFLFVDESGEVYETGFIALGGGFSRFSVYDDGSLGEAVDTVYFQSFYCDVDGNFVWSRFDEGENDVDLIYWEASEEDGHIFDLGSFDQSVWPVGGVYEQGKAPVFNYEEMIQPEEEIESNAHATEAISADASTERIGSLAPLVKASGTLNSADDAPAKASLNKKSVESVSITAIVKAEKETTNGVYTFEYDPEVYGAIVMGASQYTAYNYNDEEGKVTIAFAFKEPVAEGEPVAIILLAQKEGAASDADKSLAVTTVELNDEHPGTVEKLFVTTEEPEKPYVNPFVDVPATAWFFNSVKWAIENEITAGTDETHFSPNAAVTRAQAVTFLYAAAGKPEVELTDKFSDVGSDAYYAKAVAWAVENGITAGTSAGKFSPDSVCTREQIVTFLYAFAGKPEVTDAANPFKDVKDGAWYTNAVLWAFENHITYGTGADTFGLGNTCTRAQIVTFLFAAFGAAE